MNASDYKQAIESFLFFPIEGQHFLYVSLAIFVIGIVGFAVNNRNLIRSLLAIELMLLAVNLNFVCFSSALHDLVGQVFALMVMAIAAAETAIGLAIIILCYRQYGNIEIARMNKLKG